MWDFHQFNNHIAAIDAAGNQLSYKDLIYAGDRLAREIGERCLIFIFCTNRIGSLVGYTAALNHKIVPLLLKADLDAELCRNLLSLYKPDYLWLPADSKLCFEAYSAQYEAYEYSLFKNDHKKSYPLCDDLCLLLTTSGSTGSPKLVRQSYQNVLSNAEAIVQYLELDETERPITTLPMNYTYGLSIINSHLLVGATILMTESALMQKEFWEFFKRQGATSFGGVPYTYEMLNRLRFFRMDLPTLRTMTQAGGKLSPELHKSFAEYALRTGKHFIVMYGQTEATARMSYLPWQKSLEKYGSMGVAIPGGRFSLIDTQGKEIAEPEVVGELVYEGPNVTLGYAECGEDLAKGDERRGVLVTGDMAKRDADGYYYIVGRKKRFLKIFGNRVNMDEIDRMVKTEFDLVDFASAGVDDRMYLFVTEISLKDKIRSFLAEKTGLNSSAFCVVVVESIPKNESGKILYKELEPYYT